MAIWKNCRMEVLFYDSAGDAGGTCEVKIDEHTIVVTYEGDDGWVNYTGKNDDSGHFDLHADRYDGHASLHRFPEGRVLEGYWTEQGVRGMWRIHLG